MDYIQFNAELLPFHLVIHKLLVALPSVRNHRRRRMRAKQQFTRARLCNKRLQGSARMPKSLGEEVKARDAALSRLYSRF